MPEQVAKSGEGQQLNQTTTTSHSVVFSCCCIPFCVGYSGRNPNTLKLVGVICTGLALVFSAVVVGLINDGLQDYYLGLGNYGYYRHSYYNLNSSACEYARFCGGVSIALSLIYAAIYGLRIKPIVSVPFLGTKAQLLGEIGAAAVLAVLFGVCAIVLSAATIPSHVHVGGTARAVSAFSYFATFCWVGLATTAYMFFQVRGSEAPPLGNNPA